MQRFEVKFRVKNSNGNFGNVMLQVVSAWSPTQALEQVKAMYGGASQVEIFMWKPA